MKCYFCQKEFKNTDYYQNLTELQVPSSNTVEGYICQSCLIKDSSYILSVIEKTEFNLKMCKLALACKVSRSFPKDVYRNKHKYAFGYLSRIKHYKQALSLKKIKKMIKTFWDEDYGN